MRQFSRSSSTRRILMSFIDSPVPWKSATTAQSVIISKTALNCASNFHPPGLLARSHDLVNLRLERQELILHPVLVVVERRIAALEVLQADLRQLEVRLRAALE